MKQSLYSLTVFPNRDEFKFNRFNNSFGISVHLLSVSLNDRGLESLSGPNVFQIISRVDSRKRCAEVSNDSNS